MASQAQGFRDGLREQLQGGIAAAREGGSSPGRASEMMDVDPNPAPDASSVPVYVMLPLDTVNADGVFRYASSRWFNQALRTLQASGIRGVAVDVWVR